MNNFNDIPYEKKKQIQLMNIQLRNTFQRTRYVPKLGFARNCNGQYTLSAAGFIAKFII
jgi:hypothetical protein